MADRDRSALDDGKELIAKIAPGPWEQGNDRKYVRGADFGSANWAGPIAQCYGVAGSVNAEFIVWCRTHVPDLIADNERLQRHFAQAEESCATNAALLDRAYQEKAHAEATLQSQAQEIAFLKGVLQQIAGHDGERGEWSTLDQWERKPSPQEIAGEALASRPSGGSK